MLCYFTMVTLIGSKVKTQKKVHLLQFLFEYILKCNLLWWQSWFVSSLTWSWSLKIIVICRFGAQGTFLIIIVKRVSHTHTTHTHTHNTHTLVFVVYGTSIGVMVLYCTSYVLLPYTYPNLNLASQETVHLFFPQKTHSVWFISVLNYGDTENVLINHLLLVMSYSCHYTNLSSNHKCPHTHTYTHTTHTF